MKTEHDDEFTLRWYRDQGNGQAAADATGAVQLTDGTWPVAVLPCADYADAERRWKELYDVHGVNANTYYPLVRSQEKLP